MNLIDVAVPLDHNIQSSYATKINKYIELSTEIKAMWGVEIVKIRPIIISVNGLVPVTLCKHLKELEIEDLTSSSSLC